MLSLKRTSRNSWKTAAWCINRLPQALLHLFSRDGEKSIKLRTVIFKFLRWIMQQWRRTFQHHTCWCWCYPWNYNVFHGIRGWTEVWSHASIRNWSWNQILCNSFILWNLTTLTVSVLLYQGGFVWRMPYFTCYSGLRISKVKFSWNECPAAIMQENHLLAGTPND